MKLSVREQRIMGLLQKGWALGTSWVEIGHTRISNYGVLQKNGLGHGDPSEHCQYRTILALSHKGLIKQLGTPTPFVSMSPWILTKKGKDLKL
jgi:hypothetical protein